MAMLLVSSVTIVIASTRLSDRTVIVIVNNNNGNVVGVIGYHSYSFHTVVRPDVAEPPQKQSLKGSPLSLKVRRGGL